MSFSAIDMDDDEETLTLERVSGEFGGDNIIAISKSSNPGKKYMHVFKRNGVRSANIFDTQGTAAALNIVTYDSYNFAAIVRETSVSPEMTIYFFIAGENPVSVRRFVAGVTDDHLNNAFMVTPEIIVIPRKFVVVGLRYDNIHIPIIAAADHIFTTGKADLLTIKYIDDNDSARTHMSRVGSTVIIYYKIEIVVSYRLVERIRISLENVKTVAVSPPYGNYNGYSPNILIPMVSGNDFRVHIHELKIKTHVLPPHLSFEDKIIASFDYVENSDRFYFAYTPEMFFVVGIGNTFYFKAGILEKFELHILPHFLGNSLVVIESNNEDGIPKLFSYFPPEILGYIRGFIAVEFEYGEDETYLIPLSNVPTTQISQQDRISRFREALAQRVPDRNYQCELLVALQARDYAQVKLVLNAVPDTQQEHLIESTKSLLVDGASMFDEILTQVRHGQEQCLNDTDPLSREAVSDIDDLVHIVWHSMAKPMCYSKEYLAGQIRAQPDMREWIQNPEANAMGSEGHGGQPADESTRVVKVGENYWVRYSSTGIAELLDDDSAARHFTASVEKERQRIGNARGIFGVSMLHGQEPGVTIYRLEVSKQSVAVKKRKL